MRIKWQPGKKFPGTRAASVVRAIHQHFFPTAKSVLNQAHSAVDRFQRDYGMAPRDDRDDNMLAVYYAFRALDTLPAASTAALQRANILKALTALTKEGHANKAALVTILVWVRESFQRPPLRSILKGSYNAAWLLGSVFIIWPHIGNALSGTSNRQCAAPHPAIFLQQYQATLDIPPGVDPVVSNPRAVQAVDAKPDRVWFGIEWFGPTGGTLAVIDCRGTPLASLALGGVEQIRRGPVLPDGSRAYEVRYTAGTGTGFRRSEVALVEFNGTRIQVVWRHTLEEISESPGQMTYEDRFHWRYYRGQRLISVRGIRQPPHPAARKTASLGTYLTSESFCWTQKSRTFNICQN